VQDVHDFVLFSFMELLEDVQRCTRRGKSSTPSRSVTQRQRLRQEWEVRPNPSPLMQSQVNPKSFVNVWG